MIRLAAADTDHESAVFGALQASLRPVCAEDLPAAAAEDSPFPRQIKSNHAVERNAHNGRREDAKQKWKAL